MADPFVRFGVDSVINASGKMTALGGSAVNASVAEAMAEAAVAHVDLADLRASAGRTIAARCGAESATITTGAAAGIAIAVAAVLTGDDLEKIRQIPHVEGNRRRVLLQAGHDIDFGAPVVQMIRMGGGVPLVVGAVDGVTVDDLTHALGTDVAALLFVQSHHCEQRNRLSLSQVVDIAGSADLPLIVDAAAEEDLERFVAAGADMVIYSGGKAIGGPTSGFICGKAHWIDACEAQTRGIARAMKVGKEQIAGLLSALERYPIATSDGRILDELDRGLSALERFTLSRKADRAGRDIERLAIHGTPDELKRLVAHLAAGAPSIRTRNHQLKDGYIQIDTRELHMGQVPLIVERFRSLDRK
jgi:L-seryl-tRNA(Ser) seleniumtransferase/D-glucosaminate-6-phosphate ammonia-lyase